MAGDTWVAKASNRSWINVAASSDGTIQTAVVYGGQIYVSTDSGNTWTAKDSSRNWYCVAVSGDGTKQVAGVLGGQIYVSTDSGNTWTAKDSSRNWISVAASNDGTKQTAVVLGGQIYTSTDSGNTWTARDSNRNWRAVAMSSNGTIQTAVVDGGQIYVSTDSGNNWTAKASSQAWRSVAVSSDGATQTAAIYGGRLYVSNDSGNTWTATASSQSWYDVAMSSNGTIQTAVVDGGQIYVSTDSGNNWTAKDSNRGWRAVAISSSGAKQTAVAFGGQIYISNDAAVTTISTTPASPASASARIIRSLATIPANPATYTAKFAYGLATIPATPTQYPAQIIRAARTIAASSATYAARLARTLAAIPANPVSTAALIVGALATIPAAPIAVPAQITRTLAATPASAVPVVALVSRAIVTAAPTSATYDAGLLRALATLSSNPASALARVSHLLAIDTVPADPIGTSARMVRLLAAIAATPADHPAYVMVRLSNTGFRDWLRSNKRPIVLAEIKYWDGDAEQTAHLSRGGYVSSPWDIPANTPYIDALESVPTLRMGIDSPLALGDIVISNPNGERDDWLGYGWDRRRIRLLIGDPAWSLADFRPLLAGVVDGIRSADHGSITLAIRDKRELLNVPVQSNLIAGGPSANNPVPLAFGRVFNIEPAQVDPSAVFVALLTASGTTATAWCPFGHPFVTGSKVKVAGAEESTWNSATDDASSAFFVTRLDSTHFSYVLPSAPAYSPASGTISATLNLAYKISSLTYDPGTGKATATISGGHPFTNGQVLSINGAREKAWNGDHAISEKTGTTFVYYPGVQPSDPDTGAGVTTGTGTAYATPTLLTYQIHDGQAQAVTAARDNGAVGVPITADLTHGRLALQTSPSGRLTLDAWGEGVAGTETATVLGTWVSGLTWSLADHPVASISAVKFNGSAVVGWTSNLSAGDVTLPSSAFTLVADVLVLTTHSGGSISPVAGVFANAQLPYSGTALHAVSAVYLDGVSTGFTGPDGFGVVSLSPSLSTSFSYRNGSGPINTVSGSDSGGGVYVFTTTDTWDTGVSFVVGSHTLPGTLTGDFTTPLNYSVDFSYDAGSGITTLTLTLHDLTGFTLTADYVVQSESDNVSATYQSGLTWLTGSVFDSLVSETSVRINGITVSATANGAARQITLVDPPGPVTADIAVLQVTAADLAQIIATREYLAPDPAGEAGNLTLLPILTTGDLDTAAFNDFRALVPAPLGICIRDRQNALAVLDQILSAVGGYQTFSRAGLLRPWRLDLPSGSPALEFGPDDIHPFGVRLAKQEPPWKRVRVENQRNWTRQDISTLAGSVTLSDKTRYSSPALSPPASRINPIAQAHPGAPDPDTLPSLFYRATDAQAEAARLALIRANPRNVFEVDFYGSAYGLELGWEIKITYPRFGFESGANCIVVGIAENLDADQVTVTVWK